MEALVGGTVGGIDLKSIVLEGLDLVEEEAEKRPMFHSGNISCPSYGSAISKATEVSGESLELDSGRPSTATTTAKQREASTVEEAVASEEGDGRTS